MLILVFKVGWTEIAQRRVLALAIVENLDVLDDGFAGCSRCWPWLAMNQLLFQSCKETLDDSVIPTIASSAHAANDASVIKRFAVISTGVLATTV
jgi:hypothetical protein